MAWPKSTVTCPFPSLPFLLPGSGTNRRQAVMSAISRKGYWHLAKTLTTQTGMTNERLQKQGLVSVRDLWMKAHGYA